MFPKYKGGQITEILQKYLETMAIWLNQITFYSEIKGRFVYRCLSSIIFFSPKILIIRPLYLSPEFKLCIHLLLIQFSTWKVSSLTWNCVGFKLLIELNRQKINTQNTSRIRMLFWTHDIRADPNFKSQLKEKQTF